MRGAPAGYDKVRLTGLRSLAMPALSRSAASAGCTPCETSRSSPGGGYTSTLAYFSKRHGLLSQMLFDEDAGDPIYTSTAPFEMLHKFKVDPGYRTR